MPVGKVKVKDKSMALYRSLQTLGPKTACKVNFDSEFTLPDFWSLNVGWKLIVE